MAYRVGYLVNSSLRDKFFGYQPNHLMVYAGHIVLRGYYHCDVERDDLNVAEDAFVRLNRDDRPFAQSAPSMSVGDVVDISGGNYPGHRYYACESAGFRRIDPPIEFVLDDGRSCAEFLHDQTKPDEEDA